jgi:hypothetical protein
MCTDIEMYGDVDVEALAKDVTLRLSKDATSMALTIVAMMAQAKEELAHDVVAAGQTLNRAQFLIHRCCPMLHPEN